MIGLGAAVAALEDLVPLRWAEEWDNVGLLVEPPRRLRIRRVLLAIDLTPPVLAEARTEKVQLVVAYHPVVFSPLRRLPAAHLAVACLAAGIAVWSPHTALDAAPGGVNDWLADAVGPGERRPLSPTAADEAAAVGQGRLVVLRRPARLTTLVRRIKAHLGLDRLRVAETEAHEAGAPIATVALCAGAGGSVLAGQAADLWLTGEMRHHDVLAAVGRGTSVVLSEHSHTERGFLPTFAERIHRRLGVEVVVSRADRDPLHLR